MSDLIEVRRDQVSVEYLNECFHLDDNSGQIEWKIRPPQHFSTSRGSAIFNSKYAGKRPGKADKGYLRAGIKGKKYFVHRIIWALKNGAWPSHEIDHINGNTMDNRIENLRDVPTRENGQNKTKSNSPTPIMGVSWHKGISKWVAYIGRAGAGERLGSHLSLFDAVCARKAAELRHCYHKNHGRGRDAIHAAGVPTK